MPLDPSIPLQVRPVELQNPLAQYAQFSQIQNAQNQNALARFSISKAQRDQEVQNALGMSLSKNQKPDGTVDWNAVKNDVATSGYPDAIPTINSMVLGQQEKEAQIAETKAKTGKATAETGQIQQGQKAQLAAALYQNPTNENVLKMYAAAPTGSQGEDMTGLAMQLLREPDLAARKQILTQLAMLHQQGREALQAALPKISYIGTNNAQVPVNTNTLAGPATNVGGAQAIPMGVSPADQQRLAIERAKYQYETGMPAPGGGYVTGAAPGVAPVAPAAGAPAVSVAAGAPANASILSPKTQQELAKGYQEKRFANTAEYEKGLNESVAQAADLNIRQQEINKALQDFQTGGGKEARSKLAQYAQAVPGMPKSVVNGIAGGDLSAAQEFQKLQVANAMEQLRLAMGGTGRITQSEFAAFQQANPNLNSDPDMVQKVMNFVTRQYQIKRDEQQTFNKWLADGKNPNDFRAFWDQESERKGYVKPDLLATPKGSAAAASTTQATAALPRVTSDADYRALKPNTQYVAPDGSIRTKR